MDDRKKRIIMASIDLFAEHGYMNVSNSMIAKSVRVARGDIYYHFKNGKDDIIQHIVKMFAEIIDSNTQDTIDWNAVCTDSESVLPNLFYIFKEEESEMCRKINRILFNDRFYVKDIHDYMTEHVVLGREARMIQCFKELIRQKLIKPFNIKMAAELLNKTLLSVAQEDAYQYPFEKNALPSNLIKVQNNCKYIIDLISSGKFP